MMFSLNWSFSRTFLAWEKPKVTWNHVRRVGGLTRHWFIMFSQEIVSNVKNGWGYYHGGAANCSLPTGPTISITQDDTSHKMTEVMQNLLVMFIGNVPW